LRKDISVSSLKYIEEIRLIVVGTNVGSVVFYDVETEKIVEVLHLNLMRILLLYVKLNNLLCLLLHRLVLS
jgi:hypothetical protein